MPDPLKVPVELTDRVRDALRTTGQTQSAVARSTGINRGQFSRFLSGEVRLGPEKLRALADHLHLERGWVLRMAGFPEEGPEITLSQAVLTPQAPMRLEVFSDGRFYDSALFLWTLCELQPLLPLGITCVPRHVNWSEVPDRIARADLAIGFYNRKVKKKGLENIGYWTDLTIYRGYALIGRRIKGLLLSPPTKYLEELRKKRGELKILTIAADTLWQLQNPLPPGIITESTVIQIEPDADRALMRFAKEGEADLFVGGLPQRLKARELGLEEVINSRNNPLLFSLNSLVFAKSTLDTPRGEPLLGAVSSVWFRSVQQLRSSTTFREAAVSAIPEMLNRLGVADHSIDQKGLDEVLPGPLGGEEYEIFPESPTDLLDAYNSILLAILTSPQVAGAAGELHHAVAQHLARIMGQDTDQPVFRIAM